MINDMYVNQVTISYKSSGNTILVLGYKYISWLLTWDPEISGLHEYTNLAADLKPKHNFVAKVVIYAISTLNKCLWVYYL